MWLRCSSLALLAGCARLLGFEDPHALVDGNIDTKTVDVARNCRDRWNDGTMRFSPPTRVDAVSVAGVYDRDPWVSPDESAIIVSSLRAGGPGGTDLWTAIGTAGQFGTPVVISENSVGNEGRASLSADLLMMVFASDRPGGSGGVDVWATERSPGMMTFPPPTQPYMALVNNTAGQFDPELSADKLRLYLAPTGSPQKIMVASRADVTAVFGVPIEVAGLNTGYNDADPSLTDDERLIVFASQRPGGPGGVGPGDLWYATRPSKSDAFSTPRLVADVNSTAIDGDPAISRDGCKLYFASNRSGDFDIYVAVVSSD